MSGKTDRTGFGRKAERGSHELDEAFAVIDAARVGHVGFNVDGQPYVMPMAYARDGNRIVFHGSTGSRAMRVLSAGASCCFTITHLDGLVLARSAFESSMNYRSTAVLGECEVIEDADEKWRVLDVITDHLFPERRGALRPMMKKEVAATSVLALPIVEFSTKSRVGGPKGEEMEDVHWPVWAGTVPMQMSFGTPVDADDLDSGLAVPPLLSRWQA